MKRNTPEAIVLTGTVIETQEKSGRNIVNIATERLRLDLEIEPSFEIHLGDRVTLEAAMTINAVKPYVLDPHEKDNT